MGILVAMIKIICAIVVGFFLYRKKVFTEETNNALSKLITTVCAACMIFSSITSLEQDNRSDIITLILIGFGLYVFLFAFGGVCSLFLSPDKKSRGTYHALVMFGNTGFLAFPIGQAFMGDIGVSYLAVLNVFQTAGIYCVGMYLLTKGNEGSFKFSPKKLLNPGIVSAVIALIIFFCGIQLPEYVFTVVDFIGDITSPLAMLVIGSMIGSYPLKNLFTNWRYYILALIKLVILPLIVFSIAYLIWGIGNITFVVTLHTAMPSAVIVSMVALAYGGNYKLTSSATGLMNILCMGTIPLMWIFMQSFV